MQPVDHKKLGRADDMDLSSPVRERHLRLALSGAAMKPVDHKNLGLADDGDLSTPVRERHLRLALSGAGKRLWSALDRPPRRGGQSKVSQRRRRALRERPQLSAPLGSDVDMANARVPQRLPAPDDDLQPYVNLLRRMLQALSESKKTLRLTDVDDLDISDATGCVFYATVGCSLLFSVAVCVWFALGLGVLACAVPAAGRGDPYRLLGWAGDVGEDEQVIEISDSESPSPRAKRRRFDNDVGNFFGNLRAGAANSPNAGAVPAAPAEQKLTAYQEIMRDVDAHVAEFRAHAGAPAESMSAYEREYRGRIYGLAKEIWRAIDCNRWSAPDIRRLLAIATLEWDVRALPTGIYTFATKHTLKQYDPDGNNLPSSTQQVFNTMLHAVAGAYAVVDARIASDQAAAQQAAWNVGFAANPAGQMNFQMQPVDPMKSLAAVIAASSPADLKLASEKQSQAKIQKWGAGVGKAFFNKEGDGIWRHALLRERQAGWVNITEAKEAQKTFCNEYETDRVENYAIECGDCILLRENGAIVRRPLNHGADTFLPRNTHCYRRMSAVNINRWRNVPDPGRPGEMKKACLEHVWEEEHDDPDNPGETLTVEYRRAPEVLYKELMESTWFGNGIALKHLFHVIRRTARISIYTRCMDGVRPPASIPTVGSISEGS